MSETQTFNLYFIRHQKVDGAPALYGKTNIGVQPDKQQELASAITDNIDFAYVYTSPLKRCMGCADLLTQQSNLQHATVIEGLREFDFGDFDGIPFQELEDKWPTVERFFENPSINTLSNAELVTDFYQRIDRTCSELFNSINDDSVIMCHGGVVRMLVASILELDCRNPKLFSSLQIENGSVTKVKVIKFLSDEDSNQERDATHISVEYIGRQLI